MPRFVFHSQGDHSGGGRGPVPIQTQNMGGMHEGAGGMPVPLQKGQAMPRGQMMPRGPPPSTQPPPQHFQQAPPLQFKGKGVGGLSGVNGGPPPSGMGPRGALPVNGAHTYMSGGMCIMSMFPPSLSN